MIRFGVACFVIVNLLLSCSASGAAQALSLFPARV